MGTLLNKSDHIASSEWFRQIQSFVMEIVQLDLFYPREKGYSFYFTLFLSLMIIVYS